MELELAGGALYPTPFIKCARLAEERQNTLSARTSSSPNRTNRLPGGIAIGDTGTSIWRKRLPPVVFSR